MKQLQIILTVSSLFLFVTNSCSQGNNPGSSSILGIFVASTPCSNNTRPLPGISGDEACELIKWNVTLYEDVTNNRPTTYKLHCVFGLSKQGTTGFINGGKVVDIDGTWTIIKGTKYNPNAIAYRLIDQASNKTISFMKLSDRLLHLLDSNDRLMIGSAAWSYTLNKTGNN